MELKSDKKKLLESIILGKEDTVLIQSLISIKKQRKHITLHSIWIKITRRMPKYKYHEKRMETSFNYKYDNDIQNLLISQIIRILNHQYLQI